MSNFTEQFITNALEMYKFMFFFFGIATYPLWGVKMAADGDWILVFMLFFGALLPIIGSFVMTFTRYKERKEFNNES